MTQEEILALPKRKFLIWLRNFVGLIPKEEWCINQRTNENQQHCILGFIEKEFGLSSLVERRVLETTHRKGLEHDMFGNIVISNNGYEPKIHPVIAKLDNPKDRVLKHINLKLVNKI